MSDTDDTDDLLLIPPDFFVLDSELDVQTQGPYYSVVNNLITLVNDLETRVNNIENSTDNLNSILDSTKGLSPLGTDKFMSTARRVGSSDDLRKYVRDGFESTQSTPQKPRATARVNSLPSSPSTHHLHLRRVRNAAYPSKSKEREMNLNVNGTNEEVPNRPHKAKMFDDINEFISNVNVLKRISAARNLDQDFQAESKQSQASESMGNYDDNKLLSQMEKQLESELMMRGFGMKANSQSKESSKESSQVSLINKLSVTTLNDQIPSTVNDSFNSEFLSEDTSFASSHSQPTVFQSVTVPRFDKLFQPQLKNPKQATTNRGETSSNVRLLSLNDLWSKNEEETINSKLEEEKIKRQHCELMIQTLQTKNLELHQKLAVALEVDKSKDDAILKFHEAWEKVAIRLEGLIQEKNSLEDDLKELHLKSATDLADAAKKIAHYECETSKALNLAHLTQEKLLNLEKTNSELLKQVENFQKVLDDTTTNYERELQKNEHYAEIIAEKEIELNRTKNCLDNARTEISESKKAVDLCQAEFIKMKTEYTQLELQMNNDRDRIRELESLNKKLQIDVDHHKRLQKELQEEVNKAKEHNELNKLELRNFYQDQVEIVVKDKLKEFQMQLDHAENSLQDELKKRELTIIKSAAIHIQQITEKHQLEIQLLEEKQKEEVRLYQIKLTQAQRQMEDFHQQLQLQKDYKATLAGQLHKVMEAQWHEAVRILNNGRSPGFSHDHSLAFEQLNSLKSRSYNNLEELLSMSEKKLENDKMRLNPGFDTTVSSAAGDFEEFKKTNTNMNETPVTSKQPRSRAQIESDLQQFINLLINRPKQNSDKDQQPSSLKSQNNDMGNWQSMVPEESKPTRTSSSSRKHKPPWK